MLQLIVSLFFFVTVYSYTQEALQDQIKNLPGLPANESERFSNMFSGYIVVDASHNRSMFYWFIESLNDPTTDPLVLWTNGGPGCSGLLGLMTENGPFRAQENGKLNINPYSWVNVANIVFIETPAGVGFSFSDVASDYHTGDGQTAIDNYNFILGFLNKFPEYKNNDFHIASESYGGHYMPTLGKQIVLGNNNGNTPKINFKGIFVGNPYTDPVENKKGQYDTWWGHQLLQKPLYDQWFNNCLDGNVTSVACEKLEGELTEQIGNLDPYALDFPVCELEGKAKNRIERFWFVKKVLHDALHRPLPKLYRGKFNSFNDLEEAYQACSEDFETEYLNRDDVQVALHAKTPTFWRGCSTKISYNESDMRVYMEPIWQWLLDNGNGLHMTIVSGDDDSVCGTLGTQSWLWSMGWTLNQDIFWQDWNDTSTGQVGGYLTKWIKGLNLVTVHTAGHMIPQTQPSRSLQTFINYLAGVF